MMDESQQNLRAHVTRTGFDLSLGKTHIAALVWLEELRRHKWESTNFRRPSKGSMGRAFNNFVSGMRGLQDRGLVEHHYDRDRALAFGRTNPTRRREDGVLQIKHDPKTWKITKAGKLVIGLLKESGLYDEYADQIRPEDERKGNGDPQAREAS